MQKVFPQPTSDRRTSSPWRFSRGAWIEVLKRTWREASDDRIGLVAAGVAFYGFLALVPLLGALVLSYGLIADPATIAAHVQQLTATLPQDAASLITDQLRNVVETSGSKKGLGLAVALLLALFGARNGASAVVTALDIAYDEEEKRGFVRLNLLALAITLCAIIVALMAVGAITALGTLGELFPGAGNALVVGGKILSYLLLTLAGAAGAATLYRYGPDRDQARWTRLTPGSLFAALTWIVLTLGFGFYVANFGDYNATYGSLGAVVVLLTWLYLSAYVLLLGAELNAECEHQTASDTTVGPSQPIGQRGALVADTVAHDSCRVSGSQALL